MNFFPTFCTYLKKTVRLQSIISGAQLINSHRYIFFHILLPKSIFVLQVTCKTEIQCSYSISFRVWINKIWKTKDSLFNRCSSPWKERKSRKIQVLWACRSNDHSIHRPNLITSIQPVFFFANRRTWSWQDSHTASKVSYCLFVWGYNTEIQTPKVINNSKDW